LPFAANKGRAAQHVHELRRHTYPVPPRRTIYRTHTAVLTHPRDRTEKTVRRAAP